MNLYLIHYAAGSNTYFVVDHGRVTRNDETGIHYDGPRGRGKIGRQAWPKFFDKAEAERWCREHAPEMPTISGRVSRG